MMLTDTLRQQALTGAATLTGNDDSLSPLRSAARTALEQSVFPDRKTEQWKYTSLRALESGHLQTLAAPLTPTLAAPDFGGVQLIIANGRPPKQMPTMTGLTFSQESSQEKNHQSQGAPESPSVFSLFNHATLHHVLRIDMADNQHLHETLHLVLISENDTASSASTRVEINVGKGSTLTVIEHYLGRGNVLASASTQINAAANSTVQHYRLQSENASTLHIGKLEIHQQRDSRVSSYQVMQANTLRRNDVRIWMHEPGADLKLRGIFIAREKTHVDNQVCVEHAAPHCTSDQIFKGIAGESGKAVFNGRIHIHPGAKGSDAKLNNNNLLLSNGAEIDSKPELEIYNDDVKCAHGTTIGQMDHQQMFYLQSRGITLDNAKKMLGIGFINELLLAFPNERVAQWARDWLSTSL